MRIARAYLAGGLAALLALDLLLRLLPVSTGFGFQAVDAANPVLRGMPGAAYVYSRGWNMRLARAGRLNSDGFIASYDFLRDRPSVAVIGNSFVQAAALDPADTFQENLHRAASSGRQVVAIGQAGAHAADYVAAAAWARANYRVESLVVVLTVGDVRDSEQPKSGGYHFRVERSGEVEGPLRTDRVQAGGLAALANRSRLLRYLYDNLAVHVHLPGPATIFRGHRPSPADAGADAVPQPDSRRVELLATTLLERLPAASGLDPDQIVIVIDADRPAIRSGQPAEPRDIDALAKLARTSGFRVVDLDSSFRAAGPPLDFLPLDGHWNARAHAIAAREVLAQLPPR
jgi:hypothetical protein